MISLLLRVVDPATRSRLTRMILWQVVDATACGVVLALTVPLVRALRRPNGDGSGVRMLALALACVMYAVVHRISLGSALASDTAISRGLHHRLGDHLISLPLGWFGGDRTGQVSTLMSGGVNDVMGMAAHLLRPLIAAVVTPATVVLALLVIDWRLGTAAAMGLVIVLMAAIWAARLTDRADQLQHTARAEAADRVIEYARLQPVLRAGNASGANARLVASAVTKNQDAARRVLRAAIPGRVATGVLIQVMFVGLLALATVLVVNDALDTALALAAMTLLVRLIEPLTGLAGLAGAMRSSQTSLDRIADVLSARPLPEAPQPIAPVGHDVRFDNVTFGYDDRVVLHEVTATLPAGTVTAVVGPSGAGKSTLARLVPRFYDVEGGTVSVGGVDVRQIAAEKLMSEIAIVFQDVYLFAGTIEENIRLARPDAGEAELAAAAQAARVDEIVARLPDGWHTQVGEGGTALSGGERQRVSIARAILKDAPIVILDEQTAALDATNAALVGEAVTALTRHRTVLIIAHQLNTIRDADQILFLDNGRIVERGTHEELIALHGRYAQFWQKRSIAAGWHL
jgi:ATP-binding cassette subfamily B protein IrtB